MTTKENKRKRSVEEEEEEVFTKLRNYRKDTEEKRKELKIKETAHEEKMWLETLQELHKKVDDARKNGYAAFTFCVWKLTKSQRDKLCNKINALESVRATQCKPTLYDGINPQSGWHIEITISDE